MAVHHLFFISFTIFVSLNHQAIVQNMKYVNDTVRRQDRLLDEERAKELLQTAEYGVLSMVEENGYPYAVPINFVYNGDNSVYLHCAPEGKKLRAIAQHPEVSFCIVGRVNLLPKMFTTEYESVVLRGTAHIQLPEEERMKALEMLIDKLAPDYQEVGRKYAKGSFHRTEIIRIDFTEYSGKRKYVHLNK
jgi:nitroimidazol reductase NimA-like FMN-containing flavoprotein (pyridoxamine 5'-phosphate oxidase superfamily)